MGGRTMVSYVEALCTKIAHAPIAPTRSEDQREKEHAVWKDAVELELIAATMNQEN
jgi:hypothetical protein